MRIFNEKLHFKAMYYRKHFCFGLPETALERRDNVGFIIKYNPSPDFFARGGV